MGQSPSLPAKPPPPPASAHRGLSLRVPRSSPRDTGEPPHPTSQIHSLLKWHRPGREGEHPNSLPNHRRVRGAPLTSAHEKRRHGPPAGRQEPGAFSAKPRWPDRGPRPSRAPTPRTRQGSAPRARTGSRPRPGRRAGGGQAHLAGAPAPPTRLNSQCHTRRVPLMQKQSLGGRTSPQPLPGEKVVIGRETPDSSAWAFMARDWILTFRCAPARRPARPEVGRRRGAHTPPARALPAREGRGAIYLRSLSPGVAGGPGCYGSDCAPASQLPRGGSRLPASRHTVSARGPGPDPAGGSSRRERVVPGVRWPPGPAPPHAGTSQARPPDPCPGPGAGGWGWCSVKPQILRPPSMSVL